MLQNFILVGLGGAVGAICRYGLYKIFPSADNYLITFFINIIGCLVIGLVMGYAALESKSSENIKLLVATGICGGFTTFSAFSAENIQLILDHKIFTAFLYSALSVCAGIAACYAGYKLTI